MIGSGSLNWIGNIASKVILLLLLIFMTFIKGAVVFNKVKECVTEALD
jgi:hypothetical protein